MSFKDDILKGVQGIWSKIKDNPMEVVETIGAGLVIAGVGMLVKFAGAEDIIPATNVEVIDGAEDSEKIDEKENIEEK